MLTVHRHYVEAVQNATGPHDLWPSVQSAIELEHSTIPPYLTALFSVKPGFNIDAAQIVESVVLQEMLHMAIACNLLNALGGKPAIDRAAFVPDYPGPLPMGVRSGLTVGLEKLSRRLVHDVFMSIEEPEQPIAIPGGEANGELADPPAGTPAGSATIGEFYGAIIDKLHDLGRHAIVGDPARQVQNPRWYSTEQLFPIHNVADAVRAIGVIVDQGEGTSTSPFEGSGEVAHYYRFGEIVNGRRLESASDGGWAYAGAVVRLEPAGVWNLCSDAKAADYPEGSQVRLLADQFNLSYSNLLRGLHQVFNGKPDRLDMALSSMIEMELTAHTLVSTPVPGTALYGSPTFEYVSG